MTRLLVIRHGETDWNAKGLMQGRADPPLNEVGRSRLEGARLPVGWEDAICLSSPLRRAMQTAEFLGLSPKPEPRLIEMDWGEWEGHTLKALRQRLGAAMSENEARGLDFRPDGGESPRDVQQRLRALLRDIEAPTVAVTHKGVLRALYALATGWDMTEKAPDKLADGCAHVFDVDSGARPSVLELNIPLSVGP